MVIKMKEKLWSNLQKIEDVSNKYTDCYVYPNGDEVSNVDIVFLCTDYSGTLSPDPEESEELRFFEAGCLPEKLSPPIVIALKAWERKKLSME